MGWAKLVIAGARAWLTFRPYRRWRARRQAKRQTELSSELIEVPDPGEEDSPMWQIVTAVAARLVPAATAVLAGYGIQVSEGTSALVTVGLAALVYIGAHAIAIWREHRKKGSNA